MKHIKAILPGCAGEGGSDGAGACCGPRVAMGGDPFDLGEDRMHGRESAPVGANRLSGDGGRRTGLTTDDRQRLKELEREVRELRRANEILHYRPQRISQVGGARPPTEVMVDFIDDHRGVYGVGGRSAQCCRLLRPHTTSGRRPGRNPSRRSLRAQRDEELKTEIRRIWDRNLSVYGARKVLKQLNPGGGGKGIAVARCPFERLMGETGTPGRGSGERLQADYGGGRRRVRPMDLVERDFTAERPNQLWVSDLTYVATWRGFVLRGLRDRCLCPADRGLAGFQFAEERPGPGCPRAGSVRASGRRV